MASASLIISFPGSYWTSHVCHVDVQSPHFQPDSQHISQVKPSSMPVIPLSLLCLCKRTSFYVSSVKAEKYSKHEFLKGCFGPLSFLIKDLLRQIIIYEKSKAQRSVCNAVPVVRRRQPSIYWAVWRPLQLVLMMGMELDLELCNLLISELWEY